MDRQEKLKTPCFEISFQSLLKFVCAGIFATAALSHAQSYSVLHTFSGPPSDGSGAEAGLIMDGQGNLYGTTELGGNGVCNGAGCGTVFKMTPQSGGTWTEQVIHNFQGTDGEFIYAPVLRDSQGNLYGTAGECYPNSLCAGTIFRLTPSLGGTWTETILQSFTNPHSQGADPTGGLTFDYGMLVGTTSGGGIGGFGNVFGLSGPGYSTYSVLYPFTGYLNATGDGAPIFETLTTDAEGNLYGTTTGFFAPADVFKLSFNNGQWTRTILHQFTTRDGGLTPSGGVAIDRAGNLYGTTFDGGAYSYGVAYKLSPNADGTWTYTVIHAFQGTPDGADPFAAPIVDRDGNVYGTTSFGGVHNLGRVFKLTQTPNGQWVETALYDFENPNTGEEPQTGSLLLDSAGNLYGTALNGTRGYGVVFEITP